MNPRTSFRGAAIAVGGLLIMAGVALASGGTDDTASSSNSPAATPGGASGLSTVWGPITEPVRDGEPRGQRVSRAERVPGPERVPGAVRRQRPRVARRQPGDSRAEPIGR